MAIKNPTVRQTGRKSLQTEPIFDSYSEADDPEKVGLSNIHLDSKSYNCIIRHVLICDLDCCLKVKLLCMEILSGLGVRRRQQKTGKAVSRIPKNVSKHLNLRGLRDWGAKLNKNDKKAIEQLKNIVATCGKRC